LGVWGLTLLGAAGCAQKSDASSEDQQAAPVVESVEVRRGTLEETAQGVGSLRASDTAELQAETAGPLEAVHFDEGATVERGQLLFSLDDEKLQRRRQAQRAALQSAKARAETASASATRRRSLADSGAVSGESLDRAVADQKQSAADVQRLRAELHLVEAQLDDTRVRAPFAGRISESRVDPGDYISVGEHLATLYRHDPLEVAFRLPERFAGKTHEGQRVHVVPAGAPELAFDTQVSYVSPAVQETGRDLTVKALHDRAEDSPLAPGMSVRAVLTLETREQRPVLPARALIGSQGGYFVFVVEKGTARRRDVEIGLREPGRVEIRKGLEPGEHVIAQGHMDVSDGSEVRVVDADADRESDEQSDAP
jgi:membrane fusion protein (multidrug efflux system)